MNYENLRRYKDGSIDYSHHLNIGRIERSRQALNLVGAISKLLQSIFDLAAKRKLDLNSAPRNILHKTKDKFSTQHFSHKDSQKAA